MSTRSSAYFVFFKQQTAYDVRSSDWSSDVCSSDLNASTRTTLICSSRGRVSTWPGLTWVDDRSTTRPFSLTCLLSQSACATVRDFVRRAHQNHLSSRNACSAPHFSYPVPHPARTTKGEPQSSRGLRPTAPRG